MTDRIEKLEADIQGLSRQVRDLETRLAALEVRKAPGVGEIVPQQEAVEAETAATAPSTPFKWSDASGIIPLVGILFIVLGGAYLLRALTEASTLTPGLGVSLGLAYAAAWAAASCRAAAKGQHWRAALHGIAASVIGYPLLWEAATRFHILRSPLDAGAMAVFTAALLAFAWYSRFQPLAWFATIGAVSTALALLAATEVFISLSIFLIVLGVTTLWMGYELEWHGLRWLAALGANVAVFGLTFRALAAEPRESPAAALTVQLLLLGFYFATIAIRTLVRARNVIPFEVVQMIASFLLGFVGAVYTSQATGYGTSVLGGAGVILGASFYIVAFAFVDRRKGRGRNFHFYTSLALLFTLTGSALLLETTGLVLAWVLFAVLMGWLGLRYSPLALTLHATVGMVAAATASGLIVYAATGLAGSAQVAGGSPSTAHFIVLAGAAILLIWLLPIPRGALTIWARIQRLLVTIIFVAGIGGIISSIAAKIWGGMPEGGVDPGILATVRTMVLALSTLILAWIGRHEKFLEWGWLVYPVLGATGVKMLLEDFSSSRYATLFAALATYGCALIFAPRLRRKT